MEGFEEAHLVDAIVTSKADPGHIWQLHLDDLPPSLTLATSHEVDLQTALELGEQLGFELPPRIIVWGVEVSDPYTISESLTPAVAKAIPKCIDSIRAYFSDRTTW
jgi:hydrogenase maturation protease